MHQLDDPTFVTRLDPKGMYDLTVAFPSQVQHALDLAWGSALPAWKAQHNNVGNNFPYTFMGFEPGTTKAQVRRCLENWNKGDRKSVV